MPTVVLNMPVDAWNAVKFVVLQFLVSVLLAETWSFFVAQRTTRLLEQGHTVSIMSTNLGRLTPANVVHDRRSGRHHDRLPARALVLMVNAAVIAFALLTEYGSSSVPKTELKKLEVVDAFSIMSSQNQQDRLLRNTKKVPVFAVREELHPTSFEALKHLKAEKDPESRPSYVLHEHLINQTTQFVLKRNESNNLILKDVCGVNLTDGNSPCSKLVEQSLSIPRTSVDKIENFTALVFNVTATHDLEFPEYTNQTFLNKIVSVQLENAYPNVNKRTKTLPNPLKPRQSITGACSGSSQEKESEQEFNILNPFWGRMELCVLTDTKGLVFVITRLQNANLPEALLGSLTLAFPGESADWDTKGSSVAMAATTDVILTFRPAKKLEPLFALACIERLRKTLLRMQFLRKLPVGRVLRLSLLLRTLGLLGPYANRRDVTVQFREVGIAAVDELFFSGIALLTIVTMILFVLAVSSRTKSKLLLPIGVQRALQLLCRVETRNRPDILLDSEPLSLPAFVLEDGTVKVVRRSKKKRQEIMDGNGDDE